MGEYVTVIVGNEEISILCEATCKVCGSELEVYQSYWDALTSVTLDVVPCPVCAKERE